MHKRSPVSLAPLAALLLAGSALARSIPNPNPSGADSDRVNRRCTTATLASRAGVELQVDTGDHKNRWF